MKERLVFKHAIAVLPLLLFILFLNRPTKKYNDDKVKKVEIIKYNGNIKIENTSFKSLSPLILTTEIRKPPNVTIIIEQKIKKATSRKKLQCV